MPIGKIQGFPADSADNRFPAGYGLTSLNAYRKWRGFPGGQWRRRYSCGRQEKRPLNAILEFWGFPCCAHPLFPPQVVADSSCPFDYEILLVSLEQGSVGFELLAQPSEDSFDVSRALGIQLDLTCFDLAQE